MLLVGDRFDTVCAAFLLCKPAQLATLVSPKFRRLRRSKASGMSSETMEVDDTPDLTRTWQTMGLEDQPVDQARTLTMRDSPPPCVGAPGELVEQLPRLLRQSDRDTMPELQVKGTLGEGGMGLVELAEQLSVGREVAVKKVRDDARSQRSTLVLLREGWTTGLLEHPNIVPIYTLGRDDDDEPVIVMKKIEGTSWLEIIDDPRRAPDAFEADDPVALHVEILIQICNAVHYAHSRGIIHRDLKPENVMLGEFGEVYLLDWGIAVSLREDPSGRLASAKDVTKPAGTPAYMAPEMVATEGAELGVYTDVFLLGAMLYEALTGEPPYSGTTLFAIMLRAHDCDPPQFDATVPPELAAICRRAMARNPEDRFPSARALREALTDYRRRRQSRRLAEQGDERLEEMRALLERDKNGDDIDESELYRTFGECRFAYEQSLEISTDNAHATDGLQTALETMANRALERDAHKAASLLISDFPRPQPEFERRLDDLEDALAERRQDYEELQQIRHDVDVDVGRRGRAIFIFTMGMVWTGFAVALAVAMEFDAIVLSPPLMFAHIVAITGVVGAVTYLGRERFFENELNRRMLLSILAISACATVYRGMIWIMDLSPEPSISIEMMMYGMAASVLAVAFERRLFYVAASWTVTALVGALWPDWLYWSFAAACALTVAFPMWMWWPRNPDHLRCPTDN